MVGKSFVCFCLASAIKTLDLNLVTFIYCFSSSAAPIESAKTNLSQPDHENNLRVILIYFQLSQYPL